MVARDLENFRRDESFHEAEHIGIGPPLDLTEKPLFIVVQEIEFSHLGDAVGKKLL